MVEVKLFTAEWCSACKNLKKTMTGMDIVVTEVDIDSIEGGEEAMKAGVRGIPMLLKPDGSRLVGNASKQKLEEFLNA